MLLIWSSSRRTRLSMISVRLGITYKRTREVMEQLNQSGIVGPLSENETAEVLITNYADLESAMPIIKE